MALLGGVSVPQAGSSQALLSRPDTELKFRSLQPGEVIHVTVKTNADISHISAEFFGQELILIPRKDSAVYQGFLGLDMGLEPGTYPLEILLHDRNEETQIVRDVLDVSPREFPFTRLQVPQRYVTPPEKFWPRIQAEKELLQMIFSVFTGEWLADGSFILPLEGNRNHNFGQKRLLNNTHRSVHSGEDIQTVSGTPVKASNSGRIAFAADLYYAGNTVIIDHGLGVFSLYCHFSEIEVKKDVFVKKGEVLGKVGATGRVTGPHLHWGFRVHGQRVDPDSILSFSLEK